MIANIMNSSWESGWMRIDGMGTLRACVSDPRVLCVQMQDQVGHQPVFDDHVIASGALKVFFDENEWICGSSVKVLAKKLNTRNCGVSTSNRTIMYTIMTLSMQFIQYCKFFCCWLSCTPHRIVHCYL